MDSGSQLSPADDVLDIEEGVEEVDVYANLTVDNDQEAAALNPDDELERLGIQVRDVYISHAPLRTQSMKKPDPGHQG